MSHLGVISCFDCNYAKGQLKFVSISRDKLSFICKPNTNNLNIFLDRCLNSKHATASGWREDENTNSLQRAILADRKYIGDTNEKKYAQWKTEQFTVAINKVAIVCEQLRYIDVQRGIERVRIARSIIKYYIAQGLSKTAIEEKVLLGLSECKISPWISSIPVGTRATNYKDGFPFDERDTVVRGSAMKAATRPGQRNTIRVKSALPKAVLIAFPKARGGSRKTRRKRKPSCK